MAQMMSGRRRVREFLSNAKCNLLPPMYASKVLTGQAIGRLLVKCSADVPELLYHLEGLQLNNSNYSGVEKLLKVYTKLQMDAA